MLCLPLPIPVTSPSQALCPAAILSAFDKSAASFDTWNATLARTSLSAGGEGGGGRGRWF